MIELEKTQRVRLSEISLKDLTQSFITYMEQAKIPAEILSSFIVVASTLCLIKARQMLPNLSQEEEEEVDNLEERLKYYEQYRNAAQALTSLWGNMRLLPSQYFAEGEYIQSQTQEMPSVSPELLSQALAACIGKIPPPPQPRAHLTERGRSLAELLSVFKERLKTARHLIFQETIQGASRQEQAVSFLAVLEMARNQEVRLEQQQAFGTLVVRNI